ncbi:MAG: glyoxalase [Salibacteraceae bacterium]
MNNQKLSIRPEISSINSNARLSIEERFQNETIRPIIKLQHNLLVAFFNNYLVKIKVDIKPLNSINRAILIDKTFNNANIFKTELKGLIIGHFTTEEYSKYLGFEREINKRIFSIIQQRIKSIYLN